MRALFLVGAGVSFAVGQPIAAQSLPPMLLISEDVRPNACGVTEDDVDAAMLSAMRYNRIEHDEASRVFLYASVDLTNAVTNCAIATKVRIETFNYADMAGVTRFATIVFCEHEGTGTMPKGEGNDTLVSNFLKGSLDKCLASLK